MGQELSITYSGNIVKGTLKDALPSDTMKIDVASQVAEQGVAAVPTADTVIGLGGVTTLGWLFLKNLDTTNFVTYGPTSGGALVPLGKILPGEVALLRLKPGVVPRWQSDTAVCNVQFKIFSN